MKINYLQVCLVSFLGLSVLFLSNPAVAYLGPGAGLGMIGSLIAIIVVALVVVLGLVIYPVRILRKRKMQARSGNVESIIEDNGETNDGGFPHK